MEVLYKPWPWYLAGAVIGLTVPTLLLLGNKRLGISSTLRQLCAACVPANIPYFKYDWKQQSWNLFFVVGILIGGFLGGYVFANPEPVHVSAGTLQLFYSWGLSDPQGLLPEELFNFKNLLTLKGFLLMIVGGFLVGFGTRWAGGCTSGHGIMGLSALQWTSLLATACFFIGGILVSHFVLPYILAL
ncbi:MAG TPA: YeeE/YedE thiosulfate transporter family protein [Chryseosolibacter sp.]